MRLPECGTGVVGSQQPWRSSPRFAALRRVEHVADSLGQDFTRLGIDYLQRAASNPIIFVFVCRDVLVRYPILGR